jgi:hypothetical protein
MYLVGIVVYGIPGNLIIRIEFEENVQQYSLTNT